MKLVSCLCGVFSPEWDIADLQYKATTHHTCCELVDQLLLNIQSIIKVKVVKRIYSPIAVTYLARNHLKDRLGLTVDHTFRTKKRDREREKYRRI